MSATFSKNEIVINNDYVKRLIEIIDGASVSITASMFEWRFYSSDFSCDVSLINHALIRAYRRGVSVFLLLNQCEALEVFQSLGLNVKRYNGSKLLHTKSFIVDSDVVVLGSHNITENAMHRNIETSLIIFDPSIAEKLENFIKSL